MAEKKSYASVYSRAAATGQFDAADPAASQAGLAEYKRRQEEEQQQRIRHKEAMRVAFSPESRRAYERLGEGLFIVLRPIFVWSAFGMGVYFTMHALAKVFGMGESSAVFPFYTSINGFFAIGVFIPMVFGLYKLYKKSSKRFWQVNLSLVAVSFAILLI